ncbi:MAG TPA: ATP-binding cassette domain-containing protein, partial [Anaerolineaceae bacterium]|nr:ATP-binding cassette domain-containing protein [Anaerolineaceae bacterium]
MNGPLLVVKDLKKHFPVAGANLFSRQTQSVKAVDGLTFHIERGETLGFVGESGCGKSTAGRVILRMIEPTSGSVTFDGRDVFTLNKAELRELRKEMQIIFQDPYASLDPRKTVRDTVGEAFRIHHLGTTREIDAKVVELLAMVGLRP